jgi:hypothetical protein
LQLATNGGTTAVTIDTSQNFYVNKSTYSDTAGNGFGVFPNSGVPQVSCVGASNSTNKNFTVYSSTDSAYKFYVNYAGGGYFAGNVGIATTSSTSGLEVYRAVSTTGSLTDASLMLSTSATTGRKVSIGFGLGGGVANTCAANIGYDVTNGAGAGLGDIYFSTRNTTADSTPTERMRITSTGNVGIGTSSPGYPLQIANSTGSLSLYVQNTNASASGDIAQIAVSLNTTNGTTRPYTYYNTGAGAYRFWVLDSGNVQNTNNSYGAFSDAKLKENIVDATPKLKDLCKVKVRQYNFKTDQTHKQIGVVAQELEEVFAGLVEEIADRDAEGNDLGTTTKTVKYSVFVPMLIKAIQEQQALITTLQTQVAELKQKVGA